MESISLKEYAEKVGYKGNEPTTLEEIQNYVDTELDLSIWDYPLEELNYCAEQNIDVVLVNTEFGLRLCEIV
jgi:hypothetical protein